MLSKGSSPIHSAGNTHTCGAKGVTCHKYYSSSRSYVTGKLIGDIELCTCIDTTSCGHDELAINRNYTQGVQKITCV